GRDLLPGVAGAEPDVFDAVEPPVLLGVANRILDDLDTPDLAGAGGESQSQRSNPAEEVEDPLPAGQAGHLGGAAVEPLRHLGVRLKEGVVGDPEPKAAELLLQVLAAEHPGRAVGAAPSSVDDRVQVDRWARDLGGRGHQSRLDLAGPAPLTDHEVPQHSLA